MTKEEIVLDALEIQRQAIRMGSYWDIEACIGSVLEKNGLEIDTEEVLDTYRDIRVSKLN
jgi:hypothetical protein